MDKGNFRRRLLGLIGVIPLLTGCNAALIDSKGSIGQQEFELIVIATGLMLIVVIPVFLMTFFFAWRYRESNKKATYRPDWAHSTKIEWVVWTIPCLIILALGTLTWITTHELDPRRPIPSENKPLVIEVVALDWQWLFIYPEQKVATINEISVPIDVPLEFHITSQTVMNSFFIPRLGGQLYAMAGMNNKLHLLAKEEGDYRGVSADFSGPGFSGMKFMVHATSADGFQQWITKVKQSPKTLQWADYKLLTKKTENAPVSYFGTVKSGLYQDIIDQFMDPGMYAHGEHGMQHQNMPMDGMTMPENHGQMEDSTMSSHAAGHGE